MDISDRQTGRKCPVSPYKILAKAPDRGKMVRQQVRPPSVYSRVSSGFYFVKKMEAFAMSWGFINWDPKLL
jgi:hypothetical protein